MNLLSKFGHDFLFQEKYYKVPKSHVKLLKTLNGKYEESGYANTILVFNYKDNKHIELETFKELSVTLCFFVRFVHLDEEFKKKYNVKSEHLSLMRRTYIDYEDFEGVSFGFAYKRPYGNSYVEGDIFEEWKNFNLEDYKNKVEKLILERGESFDDYELHQYPDGISTEYDISGTELEEEFMEKYSDFIWEVHFKTMDVVDKALKEQDLNILDFKNNSKHFGDNWEIGIKDTRFRKLKQIERSIKNKFNK